MGQWNICDSEHLNVKAKTPKGKGEIKKWKKWREEEKKCCKSTQSDWVQTSLKINDRLYVKSLKDASGRLNLKKISSLKLYNNSPSQIQ